LTVSASEPAPVGYPVAVMTTQEQGMGQVIPFPAPLVPMPTPQEIASRKLQALQLIEDTLGIGDFDGAIEQSLAQIRTQGDVVRNYRQQAEEAAGEVARIELEISGQVAAEPDPSNPGKKKFSNDTAREAEASRRKATDPGYLAALRRKMDATNQRDDAQMDLDDLEKRHRALIGARDHASNRLRAIASL
jgi:hypothetical protein